MPTTMKDIATAVGVSVGTVDRALNNRGRINAEVAQRIRIVAKQLNYRTNTVARSLVIRKKNIKIAVVLHIQRNDFFDEVINGIRQAGEEISDCGISVNVYPCADFNPEEQLTSIDQAISDGASAIIIVPIDHPNIVARLIELYKIDFPVVFLSSFLSDTPCLSSVHCDYYRSGHIGGNLVELITRGNGNVLAFSPSFSMLGHRQRMDCFINYIALNCPNIHILKVTELTTDSLDDYRITSRVLEEYPQADCILYCGSTKAGLKAIQDCGRNIKSIFYDYAPQTREALLDGRIAAAILQGPKDQGYRSVMILHEFFTADKQPDSEILIENKIILKSCIDDIPRLPPKI